MRNTDIFRDFDMVMCVTQDTLNQQFARLVETGVIRKQFVVLKEVDENGKFHFRKFDSSNDVPRDMQGRTMGDCLATEIRPSIQILKSGSEVMFVLEFSGGTATFWTGAGPASKAVSYDMAGWKYAVPVKLALQELSTAEIGGGLAAPSPVVARLNQFSSEMFRVSRLLLDFSSIQMADPAFITTGPAGTDAAKALTKFMQFYLQGLDPKTNPFSLGYFLTKPQLLMAGAGAVPSTLQPSGAAFNVYFDPRQQGLSTLNYLLVTAGGYGTVRTTPAPFDSNWIENNDRTGMKLIVSSRCLAEELFVKPVFNQVRDAVYQQIAGKVSVGPGNDYGAAKNGWEFTISQTGGNDQYENSFHVEFGTSGAEALIRFYGKILVFKRVTTDVGVGTAEAWARGTAFWRGEVRLGANAGGQPVLSLQHNFAAPPPKFESGKNTWAEIVDWIMGVLRAIGDIFTSGFSPKFFMNLFQNIFTGSVPRIGNLSVALQSFSGNVVSMMLLPAGDVLDFENARFSNDGNFSLWLKYR
jgi:hypothetical protein